MSKSLSQADLLAAQRALYSRSFKDFIAAAWPVVDPKTFKPNWHIAALAFHLEKVASGECPRLLVNIPPGAAKSLIVSVMFPAWLWTRDPTKRIISTANTLKLATRDSRKCRSLITSEWYQRLWPTPLRDDENQKLAFENSHKGAREANPISSLTGNRGNIVIVDDPHTQRGSKSAVRRLETVETFMESIPTRLNDPEHDSIIVVMQRLHEEDVSGAILDKPDLGYVHLNIPMELEEFAKPNELGWCDPRQVGDLMFPAHFTPAVLKKLKSQLGPIQYAGQFQQRPAPATDGYFRREWFHRYGPDDLPKHLTKYMTSDHAPGGKGDYNVFRIWGVDSQRNIWLLDSFRDRCTMNDALGVEQDAQGKTRLKTTGALPLIQKHKPMGWYPENDGTWSAIKSFALAGMRDTQSYCRIEPLATKGSGDKEGKAQAYQAMASMGMVHLPKGPIGDAAIDEYVQFPNGKNDDQVDADGAMARILGDILPAYIPRPAANDVDPYERLVYQPEQQLTGSDLGW